MGSHFHSWHYCTSCFLWARLAHASLEPIQHVMFPWSLLRRLSGWVGHQDVKVGHQDVASLNPVIHNLDLNFTRRNDQKDPKK